MDTYQIALFGEAEKGDFQRAHYCRSLPQLMDYLGHPPPESKGLHFAVQSLLYEKSLIFFRVKEEGYSIQDYYAGLRCLKKEGLVSSVFAIGLPGVGDSEIIHAVTPLCLEHRSIMITTEPDLYDYLTM